VTGIGAAVAMISNPVAGALSDRTTGRLGRRRPWIIGGALAGALALALPTGQHTIAGVIIGWCLAQAALNSMQASLTAAVPDQVPVPQRGVVSAAVILGLGYGVYLSVDQALVTQVLPSAAARAKDLGLINIANSGPQVVAPAIAAPLVSQFGGYPALYLGVAVITTAGSVFVWKIRSVP
jgi:MFS family permease